jgi:hypothetical protein
MLNLGKTAKKLAATIFGTDEIKNRVAKSTMKLLLSDIATLSAEFAAAKGDGALFFNPSKPSQSQYMTLKDIQTDVARAEEFCDAPMAEFLKKLMNLVQKEDVKKNPVIVMASYSGLTVHQIDLDSIDERIEQLVDAVS